jgi:hypothetical protein
MARASGLAARLLLAWPTPRKAYWTEADVAPETEAGYVELIGGLLALRMATDDAGEQVPHVLDLSAEAKEAWIPFYNRIQDEKADAEPDIKAVVAKLEGYAARFALIHHVATEVGAKRNPLVPVSKASVEAGIELAEWFNQEARRIYAYLAESDEDRQDRDLIEWIRSRGGRCTARDLQRARGSRFPSAREAEAALDALVAAGYGEWVNIAKQGGGWARREFGLTPDTNTDTDTCDARPDPDDDPPAAPSDTPPADPENSAELAARVTCVGVGAGDTDGGDPESETRPDSPSVGDDAAEALDTAGDL